MKFLIIHRIPPLLQADFYTSHPNVAVMSYREAHRALMTFLVSYDEGVFNLIKLGHEAELVVPNDERLQRKWAIENGLATYNSCAGQSQFGVLQERLLPYLSRIPTCPGRYPKIKNVLRPIWSKVPRALGVSTSSQWYHPTLTAQIRKYQPDILYVHDLALGDDFITEVRPYARLVVGQIATRLPEGRHFTNYDLVVSSLPNIVSHFRQQGLASEYLRLGFDDRIIPGLKHDPANRAQVVHIGGYGRIHEERNALLEHIANRVPVEFWGYSIETLASDSVVRRSYRGAVWGMDMYNVRHNSKINVTKHITEVAGRFCNNHTLYEATGVGSLLVTDYKDNLAELFEVGREVVAYRDPQDCVEKIVYYLDHEDDRAAIAQAGQQRVLKEHTYFHRMQELLDILKQYL